VTASSRKIDVVEGREVPWLSVVLGYGPMLPFVAGAIVVWTMRDAVRGEVLLLTIIWAAAILAFLSGARRGLSFRTEGGPTLAQIATMFCLFVLALASLIAVAHAYALFAIGCLVVGFIAILALDPIAARRGEAPLFFVRLRQPQMAIAVVSLIALLANVWMKS
jgi:hypothetical protein